LNFERISGKENVGGAVVYGCSTRLTSYSAALGTAVKIEFLAKVDAAALIERGMRADHNRSKGCVDTRSLQVILASSDRDDPIRLFKIPAGWYAQELRFVPRAGWRAEDDGWLLTYVFDESQLDEHSRCRDGAVGELWVPNRCTMDGGRGSHQAAPAGAGWVPWRVVHRRANRAPASIPCLRTGDWRLATGDGKYSGLIGALGAAVREI